MTAGIHPLSNGPVSSIALVTLIFLTAGLWAPRAEAYANFIGYGYASCLTCHANGLGSGPINDYGRGLWAAEIASRSLYSKSVKLERISELSGFAGNPENLPWWIRPHLKYRGILVQRNPGSGAATQKYYHMQIDVGTSLYFDQDQKYSFTYTAGYIPNATSTLKNSLNRFMPREWFARVQITEPLWLYAGKLEKAYGIRNIDHTSFQRSPQELSQNKQAHGAIVHWLKETYEIAANIFVGDQASLTPKTEQKGISIWSEYEFADRTRGGFSFLRSNDESQKSILLAAAHWRQGLAKGSSIMFEYGLIQKIDKSLGTASNGSYTFVESYVELTRGYNLLINLERYNGDTAANTPEQWKTGLGLLMFPINRVELRLGAQHYRQVSSEEASADNWGLQGQLHVSL